MNMALVFLVVGAHHGCKSPHRSSDNLQSKIARWWTRCWCNLLHWSRDPTNIKRVDPWPINTDSFCPFWARSCVSIWIVPCRSSLEGVEPHRQSNVLPVGLPTPHISERGVTVTTPFCLPHNTLTSDLTDSTAVACGFVAPNHWDMLYRLTFHQQRIPTLSSFYLTEWTANTHHLTVWVGDGEKVERVPAYQTHNVAWSCTWRRYRQYS